MIPGINYNRKPYVDDGSPLPSIGQRVRSLSDHITIEGTVVELDPPGRRVRVDGSAAVHHKNVYDAAKSYWTREDFNGWIPWQDLEAP
jgi:hypothetical protein